VCVCVYVCDCVFACAYVCVFACVSVCLRMAASPSNPPPLELGAGKGPYAIDRTHVRVAERGHGHVGK
jgi:hypothetical protein